jgi:hypothetical protein
MTSEMNSVSHLPFSIPHWVHWIARDSSGIWWGYSVEPLLHDSGWYENEVGDYVELGRYELNADDNKTGWKDSLMKVR